MDRKKNVQKRFQNMRTYKETLRDLKNDYSIQEKTNNNIFEKRHLEKPSVDAPLRVARGRKARARAPHRKEPYKFVKQEFSE